MKEGTPAVLLQWWADSSECYRYLRYVQDLLADGKTPLEQRFGESFTGPVIPFGAMVECYPISARDQSRLHQFGKKVLPEIFLGCALIAVRIWKRCILVADIEELEKMDASEIHPRRINAKELLTPQEERTFLCSQSQMLQQNCQEETTNSENPLQGGNRP